MKQFLFLMELGIKIIEKNLEIDEIIIIIEKNL